VFALFVPAIKDGKPVVAATRANFSLIPLWYDHCTKDVLDSFPLLNDALGPSTYRLRIDAALPRSRREHWENSEKYNLQTRGVAHAATRFALRANLLEPYDW
jgi:hypothetical protein